MSDDDKVKHQETPSPEGSHPAWPVFICYRQDDGKSVAQWLYKELHGLHLKIPGHSGEAELEVYFDQTAPAVGDWTRVHKPALERARALLLVCTPGVYVNLGPDDWVYKELRWWLANRQTAPMIVDPYDKGDKWIPDEVRRRWPQAQRVVVQPEEWDKYSEEQGPSEQNARNRIIGGLKESAQATTYEDLQRERARSKVLEKQRKLIAFLLLFAAIGTGWAVWQTNIAREQTAEAQLQAETAREQTAEAQEQQRTAAARLYELEKAREPQEALIDAARSIREKLGQEQAETAIKSNSLAKVYEAQGRYAEAAVLQKQYFEIGERAFGPDHPSVGRMLNNLANLYRTLARYAEAEGLYHRCLAITEKTFGPEHPAVGQPLNDLATLYRAQGLYGKAEPLYERSLAVSEKAFGSDHSAVATTLDSLGGLYKAQARYPEAKELYQRALSMSERALGPRHPATARGLSSLGSLAHAMGDLAGAKLYYERALAIREQTLGPEHPDTAMSLNNLGRLLHAMGALAGTTTPYYERALAIRERALGPEHPDAATSLDDLGRLLHAMGDLAGAKPYYERALAIREQTLGPEHPDTAMSLNNLGRLLHAMGDRAGAEPYYERALAIREQALGREHPATATSLNNLGRFRHDVGDLSTAKDLYEFALAIREQTLGPEHPATAISLNNLGGLFEAMGEVDRAIALTGRAREVEESELASTLTIGTEAQRQALLAKLEGSSHHSVSLHVHSVPTDAIAARLALTTVLRRKGRALDATVTSTRQLRKQLDSANGVLFDTLNELRAERAYLVLRPPETLPIDQRQQRLEELDKQIRDTESKLSAASAPLRQVLTPVTLEAVQASLPAHTALVEYFVYKPFDARAWDPDDRWGEPHYVAYVLHQSGEPRGLDLGEANIINAAAEEFRASLSEQRGDVLERAREVDALAMEGVRRLLDENVSTLILSPDGVLNVVPFAALLDEEGQYLLAQYEVSYLNSGRELLRFASTTPSRDDPLLVGDPAFDGAFADSDSRGEAKQASEMTDIAFGRLPGTAYEVAEIGRVLDLPGQRVLTGQAASETAVRAVRGPRILHLATRGFFLPDAPDAPTTNGWPYGDLAIHEFFLPDVPDAPLTEALVSHPQQTGQRPIRIHPMLRSGLALSGFNRRHEAKSGQNDGLLTALEISGLDLWGTEIVTLSACETGLGDVLTGEGVLGLRRALVLAGAQTQLITLWSVADEPTSELMISWYAQLEQGVGRAESMRQVQLAASRGEALPVTNIRLGPLTGGDEAVRLAGTQHPYYWAGFVLAGATGPIAVYE